MFFTQDDYKKIQQWLTKNSVKDTEFDEANIPFNGEETITIVQGNQNKKVFLKDLIAQVFNLGISDFVNITDKYDAPNISLEEATRLIPSRARKEGQVITFLDMEDHWHIYQFKGVLNQWNVLDQWKDLFDWEKLIIDSILPDEEDLTKSLPDKNGNSYLSLKDREYNPEDFSGLGRVILRKNIVEVEDPVYGKVKNNILYQDMFTQSNTIYEIRYDFDLNGAEITIPEGCVLDFQGGKFSNGSFRGNKTFVSTKDNLVIFANINLNGDWNNSVSYSDWFDFDKTGGRDDSINAKSLFALANHAVYFNDGIYCFSDIQINHLLVIKGCNTTIKAVLKYPGLSSVHKNVFHIENLRTISIEGITFVGDISIKWNNKYYGSPIIHCINVDIVNISDCVFKNTTGYSISAEGASLYEGQLITCRDCKDITIKGCEFFNHVKSEHIWIITHNNNRESCNVRFENNYVHDLYPINGISGNTILGVCCGNLVIDGNIFENIIYDGSIINAWGIDTYFRYNKVINCIASSVVDNCEYGNIRGERFVAEYNDIDCKNAVAFLLIASYITIKNNDCKCFSGLYSINKTTNVTSNKDNYLIGKDAGVLIDVCDNKFDLTSYDQSYSSYPKRSYQNGINIESYVSAANKFNFKNNILKIKEIDGIDKKLRQPIVVSNCRYTEIEDNIVDTDILSYISNSYGGFLVYGFEHSSNFSENIFSNSNSLILINNNINHVKSVMLLTTARTNIDLFSIESVVVQDNKSNKGLYINISNGYIKEFVNKQSATHGLHLSTSFAPIFKCISDYDYVNAYTIARLSTGCKYNVDGQIAEVYVDSSIPYKVLSESIGQTINGGTVVQFENNDKFVPLASVVIDETPIPDNIAEIPIEGVVDFMGVKWIKAYSTSATFSVYKIGSTNNRPVLDNVLHGYRYFDTTLNKPIWWTGTKWVDATGAEV